MGADELAKILQEAFERLGVSGAFRNFKDDLEDVNDALTDEEKALRRQERLLKETNKSFERLEDSIKKGRKKIIDLAPTIEQMDDALLDLEDSAEKLELEQRRNALATQYLTASYKKAGLQLLKTTGDIIVGGLIKGTKSLVSGLQDGKSGIGIATDLMIDALDVQQKQTKAVSAALETVGQIGLVVARKTSSRLIAGGLELFGSGLGYTSDKMNELAKFGVEVLSKEVEKTVKAFNDATSSGALFARGMDDVRGYAMRAGLSTDQFAAVIKNNSNLLAESGYTVTEAAKIVANVTSQFRGQVGKSGLTLQREMLNLGFGFQEQADLVAQMTADLKRTGGTATNAQMATATVEMAKNIRAISDIMGEEYKARQDQAKKEMEQYAFQEKINKLARETNDPGLLKRAELALSTMTEGQRRAAMQAYVLDGAVTVVSAQLMDGGEAARTFAYNLNTGNTSFNALTEGTRRLNDRFQSSTDQVGVAISRAAMATGELAEYSKAYSDQYQDSFKFNSENFRRSMADAEKLSGAHGGLQDSVMNAEVAAQTLRISLQEVLTPAIEKFGKVANEILDGIRARLRSAGMDEHTTGEKAGHIAATAGTYAAGGYIAGQAIGTVLGAIFGEGFGAPAGAALGGWIGTGVGGVAGGIKGTYDVLTGAEYANGGVASGPISGYQAQLHGTEAVVPLPDDRSIPVTITKDSSADKSALDTKEIVGAITAQTQLVRQLINEMRQNNNLTSGILQASY